VGQQIGLNPVELGQHSVGIPAQESGPVTQVGQSEQSTPLTPVHPNA
jgi:hypothetical protein